MSGIRSKHDEFFKNMMRHPEMAQDFFVAHLPKEILSEIQLSTLCLESSSFADEKLNRYESDMLFKVKRVNSTEDAFIYLLIEHQSNADPLMPFRLLCYIIQFLKSYIIRHKNTPLPLPAIYPLVVYNGRTVWNYDRDFFSLFGDLSERMRKILFAPSAFIDVCRMEESTLLTKHLSNLMLASLQRAKNRKELEKKVELINTLFVEFGLRHASELVYAVLKYNTVMGVDTDHESTSDYWAIFTKGFTAEYQEVIMNLEQATRRESFQQGIQQGMQQGVQQERIEIAMKMLSERMAIPVISKITDLSVAELTEIAETLN